jgi:hypothetical protein
VLCVFSVLKFWNVIYLMSGFVVHVGEYSSVEMFSILFVCTKNNVNNILYLNYN